MNRRSFLTTTAATATLAATGGFAFAPSIARAQSLEAARTLATEAQGQAQTNNFLNYGPGYQPGSAQMFH